MKQLFDWLEEQYDDRFAAQAIAMLGIAAAHPNLGLSNFRPGEFPEFLQSDREPLLRFGFTQDDLGLIRKHFVPWLVSDERLAASWKELVKKLGPPRIEISLPEEEPELLAHFVELLSRDLVGASGVYVAAGAPRLKVPISWPIGIAAPRSQQNRIATLTEDLSFAGVDAVVLAASESVAVQLLVVPANVTFVPGAEGPQARRLLASAVAIAFEAKGARPEDAMMFGLRLRYTLDTDAVIVARAAGKPRDGFLFSLLAELGQGRSLDEAVLQAGREHLERPPFLLSTKAFLKTTHLPPSRDERRAVADLQRLSDVLTRSVGTAEMAIPAGLAQTLGIERTKLDSSELGLAISRFIDRRREDLSGATAIYAKLVRVVRQSEKEQIKEQIREQLRADLSERPPQPNLRQPTTYQEPEQPSRHLHADILSSVDGVWLPVYHPLVVGTKYRTIVHIGPEIAHSNFLRKPFPEEQLPLSPQGHALTIVFADISGGHASSPEPQLNRIHLAPEGASTSCSFEFTVPERPWLEREHMRFVARILVLHQNRVLQTALLSAPITVPGKRGSVVGGVRLDVELAPSTALQALEHRTPFDAVLVLNHDAAGVSRAMIVADDKPHWLPVDHSALKRHSERIIDRLNEITRDVQRPESLDDESLRKCLITLAHLGATMWEFAVNQWNAPAAIRDGKRLQVIEAKEGIFLPVELFYERPVPHREAKVCPNARQALQAGQCTASCIQDGTAARQHVCPLGFWGLTRVIERQSIDPTFEIRGDVGLRPAPLHEHGKGNITILRHGLVGASNKVNAYDSGCSTLVRDSLQKLWPGKSRWAEGWGKWLNLVRLFDPSLILLLVHTLEDEDFGTSAIEISNEPLGLMELSEEHLPRCIDNEGLLVLLLGCSTAGPSLAFQSFVGRFLRLGASVVVGSIADMRGRHLAPTTIAMLEGLKAMVKQGPVDVGQAVARLRRERLAEGDPLMLCLAVYGDADWRLVAPIEAQEHADDHEPRVAAGGERRLLDSDIPF